MQVLYVDDNVLLRIFSYMCASVNVVNCSVVVQLFDEMSVRLFQHLFELYIVWREKGMVREDSQENLEKEFCR